MCGIAGFYSSQGERPLLVEEMCSLIRHRGPDGEGYVAFAQEMTEVHSLWSDDTPNRLKSRMGSEKNASSIRDYAGLANLVFGHRRLAIVNTSDLGHQPMSTQDSRYWVTFNGEIYNYRELRSQLECLGHIFNTDTDTEVILYGYKEWGEGLLNKLNGMWAFVISDSIERTLFISRDRFGIKPFYYWVNDDQTFYFASEIKQFTSLPGWVASVNKQRCYDFLVHGVSDHTKETMFDGVFQLPPGNSILLNLKGVCFSSGKPIETKRWYDIPTQRYTGTYLEAVDEFRSLFFDAVKSQMNAAVPLGTSLSGGLDSSSIVCVVNDFLQEAGGHKQQTFSACAEEKKFDEREYIEHIKQERGVESHYAFPSIAKTIENLDSSIWHHDEPYGSTSIHAEWDVFELAASQGMKVSLDGHGADEQLLGYTSFFSRNLASLIRCGKWRDALGEYFALKKDFGFGRSGLLKALISALLPKRLYLLSQTIAQKNQNFPKWLNYEAWGVDKSNPYLASGISPCDIRDTSVSSITKTSVPMQLTWADRDSMAHSLECRVPFLDHRLVEFVVNLPTDYKLDKGVTKKVLRDSMIGIIPPAIQARKSKLGFVTAEETWATKEDPDWFRKEVLATLDAGKPLFDESLKEEMEKFISGDSAYSMVLWRVICFGRWLKAFDIKLS